MHAHSNTLLQKMGFGDSDKRLPAHDEACISIVEDPLAILSLLAKSEIKDGAASVLLESPLTKGSGQYMSTLGFIDVLVYWNEKREKYKPRPDDRYYGKDTYVSRMAEYEECPYVWGNQSALIEVKTRIDSVGELLRQMNLYRQHAGCNIYVVWSLDLADARHAKILDSQGYTLLVGPIGAVTRVGVAAS